MSLAVLAGKVGRLSQGIAGANNSAVSFIADELGGFKLRNQTSLASAGSIVSGSKQVLDNVLRATGYRPKIYTIGEVDNSDDNLGLFQGGVASNVVRAVSGVLGTKTQLGVVIDGYDNLHGNISVALPENPVMFNPTITDHRVRTPNELTMRIYVSNMNTDNVLDNFIQSARNALGGFGNMVFGEGDTRATKALSALQWIQENGIPFTVYGIVKTWENMLIKNIKTINDAKSNDMLMADITFKEIVFYTSLDNGRKAPARKPPTAAANSVAQAAGWISRQTTSVANYLGG